MTKRNRIALLSILMLIFIDGLGLGIIFPIVAPIFMTKVHGLVPPDTSQTTREIYYGLAIAAFPFFSVIGAPILGDISDRIGRKKVLLISLAGSVVAYMISAVAVNLRMGIVFIISRALEGLTGGSVPVGEAAILDLTDPKKKSLYLGLLIAFYAIGFSIGPAIGGLLSSTQVSSYFDYATPLFFAAVLSLINMLLLWAFYKAPEIKEVVLEKIKLMRGFLLFLDAFKHKTIRWLSICFFLSQLGWGAMIQFSSLFLLQRYHYSTIQIGWFYAVLGLGLAIGLIVLTPLLERYFTLKTLAIWSLLVLSLGMFVYVYSYHPFTPWVTIAISSIVNGIAYLSFVTIYSNSVMPEHQGWVMGVQTSVWGMAWTVISIIDAFTDHFSVSLPIEIGAWLTVAACLFTLFYNGKHAEEMGSH